MTDKKISLLWSFARGDAAGQDFEAWLYRQEGLEDFLGQDVYLRLVSCNFADRDEVWQVRELVSEKIETLRKCECPKIRNLDMIPMGFDLYSEKVFAEFETTLEFGKDKWWLYISTCKTCSSIWLVAQDDRMYDDFFLKRISQDQLKAAQSGVWPNHFLTYEKVLATGRQLSNPPAFVDAFADSLIWTVEDLLKERPEITNQEIGDIIGVSVDHATKLVEKVRASNVDN